MAKRTTKRTTKKRTPKKGTKKWMGKASARMERKGTVGSFTAWCKAHGYGGVTAGCIAAALKKGGKLAKKAAFAKAARTVARRKRRRK